MQWGSHIGDQVEGMVSAKGAGRNAGVGMRHCGLKERVRRREEEGREREREKRTVWGRGGHVDIWGIYKQQQQQKSNALH